MNMYDLIGRKEAIKIARKYGVETGASLGKHSGIAETIKDEIAELPTVPAVPLDKLCALLAKNADCPPEHSPVQDHCKENCAECWESVLKEWVEEYDCAKRERKQRQ
jgi:hypothetical protein